MKKFYATLFCCLTLFFCFTSDAFGQGKTVTGKVRDAGDGSGVPGVNILEKGTSNGTVTDADGNYSIGVSDNAVLVFSFVGYITQEVSVGGRSTVDVQLQPDVTALSEVVVVGYGTQEKKEITSAVASVSAENFNRGNVTTPAGLLVGKVPGLSVTRPGGDPNQGPTLRLRGITTFGANAEPLIVINGVVGASLDNVDPNDIASIDILKDGSAAAIYGARGSGGVILVTTKSGKGGGNYTNVSYNGFATVDMVANRMDVLSPEEFVARGGQDFGSRTNWFEELTQTGVSHTNNISIDGANNNLTYTAAVNYRDNEGIVKGVNFQRLNTRLEIGNSFIDGKLRLKVNLNYNERKQESINMGAFRYATIYNPTAPIFSGDPDDDYGGFYQVDGLFDFFNPVAMANQQQFVGERRNTLSNYRFEYDVIDNLTVALNYAIDAETGINGSFWSKRDYQVGFGQQGQARRDAYDNRNRLLELTARYDRRFGDLNAEFLVGFGDQKRSSEGFAAQVKQFLYDYTGFNGLDFAAEREGQNTEVSSFKNEDVLRSLFGRANLNYKNTYFLSATIRSESWSGFGKDERTGIFPAVSAGVQITELADLGVVNSLKFRASYGVTGALPPASNLALTNYVPGGIVDFDGNPLTRQDRYVSLRLANDPNPTLKWEEKTEINVGFDFGLFDNRLTGSIEYYTRNIDDLLYGVNLPAGAPNPFGAVDSEGRPVNNIANFAWANVGSINSGGFEFAVSYNGLKFGGITYTPSFNFTIYDRARIESFKVGDLGVSEIRVSTPGSPGQNNNEIIRNLPGETLGNMYGPVFSGLTENGTYVFPDQFLLPNGDLDADQFVVVGNGLPTGEFGFTNNFVYKNWDLNFLLRGAWGHDLYNSYRGFYENRDAGSRTWNSVTTSKTPFVTSSPTFSSLYVEDASFIRLDNLTIGYNLPTRSNVISSVRFYFTGQNLFTLTKYTGIDPEIRYFDTEEADRFRASLAPGIERRNVYATTTSLTLGVNMKIK